MSGFCIQTAPSPSQGETFKEVSETDSFCTQADTHVRELPTTNPPVMQHQNKGRVFAM